jgi:hypothetical protein
VRWASSCVGGLSWEILSDSMTQPTTYLGLRPSLMTQPTTSLGLRPSVSPYRGLSCMRPTQIRTSPTAVQAQHVANTYP